MKRRDLSDALTQDDEPLSRAVLDGLDQLVIVFDSTGEANWVNASVDEIAGHPGEQDGARAFTELVADSDRPLARAAVDRLVETGELAVQLTVETADGQRLPYEFRGTAFDPPPEGPAYVAIGYSIAERQERERKLDGLRERTLELMATETKAETAELAVDAAHRIIGAPLSGIHFPDSTGERLAPVATVDSVGEAFGEPPSYPRDAQSGSRAATVWAVFEGDEPLRIDDVAAYDGVDEPTPTGSVILYPLGDHGMFIVSAPEPNAFDDTDSTLVDILAGAVQAALDRVEREGELRRQNEQLDRFTSIVSHDMRNPITTARGYLELAQETGDDAHLEDVANSLDWMETLVEDLLSLARQGGDSLSREHVVLAELAELSWSAVETAGATLRVDSTTTVWGDESRLRQLFENLFRNSVEHGSPGKQAGSDGAESALTVTVGDLADGFYVADDGVGIPESERDRVLLSGYSTGEGGTGLGLSIVEEVADAHGWSVTVGESEGGGARFEFHDVESA